MSTDAVALTEVSPSGELDDYERPPSLHWALVLVFWMLTCGLFGLIWMYRQAAWVRRIDPSSKALWVLLAAFACAVVLPPMALILGVGQRGLTATVAAARLGFAVAWVWSYFSMRRSLEERFDLSLSALLTFFVPVFYLQHHMTQIAKGASTPRRRGLFQ